MQNSTTEMGTEIAKKQHSIGAVWLYNNHILVSGEHKSSIRIIQTKLLTSHHTMIRTYSPPLACTMLRLELQLTSGVIRAIHGRMFEIAPGGTK